MVDTDHLFLLPLFVNARIFFYISEGDSSSNSMQNLLAAVRMSMTGSLTTGHHSNHNNPSRSSSSLATLSPYQSPSGRVFSPVSGGGGDFGFSPSQASAGWSLASPNRLPSIGESFFGGQNSCSSSQSRIMSPLPPMESHHTSGWSGGVEWSRQGTTAVTERVCRFGGDVAERIRVGRRTSGVWQ